MRTAQKSKLSRLNAYKQNGLINGIKCTAENVSDNCTVFVPKQMPLVLIASKSVVKVWAQIKIVENAKIMDICRIINYQVRRDLKDHLVQFFLAKTWYRQDGPAPHTAEC